MTAPHEEWLERAFDDLQFAEVGLKEEFYSQVCFLSQQVVEKCLKGVLVGLKRPYPRGHSLRELSLKIPELPLGPFRERLTVLDGYTIPLRYPDAAPGTKESGPPNKKEATDALKTAQEIFKIASEFLRREQ